ncbi:MAG: hypothetical protein ACLQNE_08220 [Thermoguttaceae bacterium]
MNLNFRLWLLLRENLDPAAYDDLFNKELDAVLPTLRSTDDRQRLASMRGFGWTNYIAACLRNAGFREQGDLEERIHDVVVKLLVSPGALFRGYDERRHGPLDLRFKRSVANAVKNVVEKENNRKKYLPSVPLRTEFIPGGVRAEDLPARVPLLRRFRVRSCALLARMRDSHRALCRLETVGHCRAACGKAVLCGRDGYRAR